MTTLVTGGNIRPTSIQHPRALTPGRYSIPVVTFTVTLLIAATVFAIHLLESSVHITTTATSYQNTATPSAGLLLLPLLIIPGILVVLAIAYSTGDLPYFDIAETFKALCFGILFGFIAAFAVLIISSVQAEPINSWGQTHQITNLATPEHPGTFYALTTAGKKATLTYQNIPNGYKVTITNTEK